MSKSQEMMGLVLDLEILSVVQYEDTTKKRIVVKAKLQAIADRQDRFLEIACFYRDELTYNDYVSRDFRELEEVKKLIAECEGKDEQKG